MLPLYCDTDHDTMFVREDEQIISEVVVLLFPGRLQFLRPRTVECQSGRDGVGQ